MKLFKHRGDIYISKSGYKSSKEERILLSLLAVIVLVTLALLVLMSNKYSSFTEFIAGDEVTVETTQPVGEDDILSMPKISGKHNFLIYETDNEQSAIHYAYLLQVDGDSLAYKACALNPGMKIDGKTLYSIYSTGGGAALMTQMTALLGVDIDFFVGFDKNSFIEFENKLGSFIYPSATDVDYSGGTDDDAYSVRLRVGEQPLQGVEVSNLLRYFTSKTKEYSRANEIILYAYTGLFNSDNYDKGEYLFRTLVTSATTNITVRDYENNKNVLYVFSNKNTDVTVYSCVPMYEGKELTQQSVQEIKGYFSK